MKLQLSRRELVKLLAAGALAANSPLGLAKENPAFRIRAITAGVAMRDVGDIDALERARRFLEYARMHYEGLGYEVQTLRIATQPFTDYCANWPAERSWVALQQLDQFAAAANLNLSIGPAQPQPDQHSLLAPWAAELIQRTTQLSFSLPVATAAAGVDAALVTCAARIIQQVAGVADQGEGNFRFAATAFCPPGSPFFPAAYHRGEPAFSIGLESPNLLHKVFSRKAEGETASQQLQREMMSQFAPLETLGLQLAKQQGRRYLGIDLSPAPGPDASIGAAIEQLTGVPFGAPSTLAGCAVITDALQQLGIQKCGYSGLMLPVLEDKVLAQRAVEDRFGVAELLLYSSVCGTGLDVVPLAGDTPIESLTAVIADMAALANKYQKPLSARLLLLPGLSAGDKVSFNNPYLVDSVVMKIH